MESNSLKKVVKDIKSLKIQGASQVRKAIVKCLKDLAVKSKARNSRQFIKEIQWASQILLNARPTEPASKTAVRVLLSVLNKNKSLEENKSSFLNKIKKYEADRKRALEKMAKYGANLIPKNAVVLTFCHSHTVEAVLKKAKKKIKLVLVPETRPLFQGRITARNLAKNGLKVWHFVDSATHLYLKKADVFLTGADSIMYNGDVVNKIGTENLSKLCYDADIPHYVCASTHKIDVDTLFGKKTKIEERRPDEVWRYKNPKIAIKNPAFDSTPAVYIRGIISEKGVLSVNNFVLEAYKGERNGR